MRGVEASGRRQRRHHPRSRVRLRPRRLGQGRSGERRPRLRRRGRRHQGTRQGWIRRRRPRAPRGASGRASSRRGRLQGKARASQGQSRTVQGGHGRETRQETRWQEGWRRQEDLGTAGGKEEERQEVGIRPLSQHRATATSALLLPGAASPGPLTTTTTPRMSFFVRSFSEKPRIPPAAAAARPRSLSRLCCLSRVGPRRRHPPLVVTCCIPSCTPDVGGGSPASPVGEGAVDFGKERRSRAPGLVGRSCAQLALLVLDDFVDPAPILIRVDRPGADAGADGVDDEGSKVSDGPTPLGSTQFRAHLLDIPQSCLD
mmetsp:Transcript_1947/g.4937  ORF Transcript_1947/g.4937 Transcript_1947/m.4937 type:complete len:316 (+) Transcript_1947:374-1321(+)